MSSAASESALNESAYDRLFADQNFQMTSTLVNPGSVTENASMRDSFGSMNNEDPPSLDCSKDREVRKMSNVASTRDVITRERLIEEIVRLRHALQVTSNELTVTENELRDVLIELAKERDARFHRPRTGSCPTTVFQVPLSDEERVTFSTIRYIINHPSSTKATS